MKGNWPSEEQFALLLVIISPFHGSVSFQKVECLELLLDIFSEFDGVFNLLGIRQTALSLKHLMTSVSEVFVSLGIISSHP